MTPAEIAASLSERHHRCLLAMSAVAQQPIEDEPAARHLYNRGLAMFTGGGFSPRKYRLTPAGIAVRALLENSHD